MVLALTAIAVPLLGATAQGSAVVRVASGTSAAALQTAVGQFRADLGGVDNGVGVGGPFPAGRREITWDDVPDSLAEPAALPYDYFNRISPRGAVFQSVGNIGNQHQFRVSAATLNPSGTAARFGNVDASYPTVFQAFSGQRLFAPRFATTIDVFFYVPGTTIPATVSGFGAVFADVDSSVTYIEHYGADGKKLSGNSLNALSNGLSFIGTSFNAGERVARVQMTLGNHALASGSVDGTAGVDVVALDDLIYGEPQADPSGFRFADAKVTGAEGGTAIVPVVRSGRGPAKVSLAFGGGSAAGGRDYTPAPTTLSFGPEETVKTVAVPLAADALAEGDETVELALVNPVGGVLADPATATLTIVDRPPAAPVAPTTPVTPAPATPAPTPTPAAPVAAAGDRVAPRLVLGRAPKTLSRAAFLRGVTVDLTPSEASALEVELLGATGRATLARAGDVTLASRTLPRAAGTRTVRLKPSAKLVAHAKRRFTARLRVTATDAAGNRTVVTRFIAVRAQRALPPERNAAVPLAGPVRTFGRTAPSQNR